VGKIPASRVRIPPSPPLPCGSPARLGFTGKHFSLLHGCAGCGLCCALPASEAGLRRHRSRVAWATLSGRPDGLPRRGGRAVECGGLENRFGRFRPTRVQIPPPPLNQCGTPAAWAPFRTVELESDMAAGTLPEEVRWRRRAVRPPRSARSGSSRCRWRDGLNVSPRGGSQRVKMLALKLLASATDGGSDDRLHRPRQRQPPPSGNRRRRRGSRRRREGLLATHSKASPHREAPQRELTELTVRPGP
jgi:hypothetical protein